MAKEKGTRTPKETASVFEKLVKTAVNTPPKPKKKAPKQNFFIYQHIDKRDKSREINFIKRCTLLDAEKFISKKFNEYIGCAMSITMSLSLTIHVDNEIITYYVTTIDRAKSLGFAEHIKQK